MAVSRKKKKKKKEKKRKKALLNLSINIPKVIMECTACNVSQNQLQNQKLLTFLIYWGKIYIAQHLPF